MIQMVIVVIDVVGFAVECQMFLSELLLAPTSFARLNLLFRSHSIPVVLRLRSIALVPAVAVVTMAAVIMPIEAAVVINRAVVVMTAVVAVAAVAARCHHSGGRPSREHRDTHRQW